LSELEAGADEAAGVDDDAGVEADVDEVSTLLPEPDDGLLPSFEDFGLALP
jgi:hypothetical protein